MAKKSDKKNLKTINLPISDIRLDPSNVRKHDKKNIEALVASLKRFGQQKPIVLDKDYIVRAGNGTLTAAKELGWENIDAVVSDLEPSELTAYAIADNRTAELAEWDIEGLTAQLKSLDSELANIAYDDFDFPEDPTEPSEKDDEIPDTKENEFDVKLGDIWLLGEHRIMCGDSTDKDQVDKLMDGAKADMVFTDPPYGLNWSGGTWAKDEKYQRAKNWDNLVTDEQIKTIIGLGKNAIIWGGNYYTMPPAKCWLSWKKPSIPTMADIELAWTNLDKPAKQFESNRTPDGKKIHGAQKPICLIEWALGIWSDPSLVLDLFLGSGSTLIACEKTNRKCYGMELDPHYVSVIIKRWQDFTGKEAKRARG